MTTKNDLRCPLCGEPVEVYEKAVRLTAVCPRMHWRGPISAVHSPLSDSVVDLCTRESG